MKPRPFHPSSPEIQAQQTQLEFPDAYQELKLRRFTADLLAGANRLRSKRQSPESARSEWEELFSKTKN